MDITSSTEEFPGGTEVTITWKNKHISLNQFYAGAHWTRRKKIVDEWHSLFADHLPKGRWQQYSIDLTFKSRLDPTNTIPHIKLLEDTMIKKKMVANDGIKECRYINIRPDFSLQNFQYKIIIKLYE